MALFWPTERAWAHSTPDTAIMLAVADEQVDARIVIPVNELRYARGGQAAGDAGAMARYVVSRIEARDAQDRPWTVELREARIAAHNGANDLEIGLGLQPPDGASPRRFTLDYDAIIGTVPNHVVLVFAGSPDEDSEPRLIGALQQGSQTLEVSLGLGEGWAGFVAAMQVGIEHILIGYDHILFVIALILPAPLLAGRGTWTGYGGFGHTARSLLTVITAFTIGHSLTLIAGAVFGWQLPVQPVEILIALSILVTAIHAWRPVFPGREAFVAAGFGLVHGLAFAAIIAEYGAETIQQARSILGFNLGIELVQIGIVALVMPALLLFARSNHYDGIRKTGAFAIGAAAFIWMVERIFGLPDPMEPVFARVFAHAIWILVAINLIALGIHLFSRSRSPGARIA